MITFFTVPVFKLFCTPGDSKHNCVKKDIKVEGEGEKGKKWRSWEVKEKKKIKIENVGKKLREERRIGEDYKR
jgi:hypothetical protein